MLTDSTQSTALGKGEFPYYIEGSPLTPAFQLFKWCLKRSEKLKRSPRLPIPRFCHERVYQGSAIADVVYIPICQAASLVYPQSNRLDREFGDKLAKILSHYLPLLMPPISSGAAATLPRRKAGTDGQSLSAEESNESLRTSHDSLDESAVY
jgi:hypothetical protein